MARHRPAASRASSPEPLRHSMCVPNRRLFGLAGWRDIFRFRGLATPGSVEQRYLRWSNVAAATQAALLSAVLGLVGESLVWRTRNELPLEVVWTRWAYKLGMVDVPFPTLVQVPPDPSPTRLSFDMGGGEASERPRHRVTFAQYDAFARATGRSLPYDAGWGRRDEKGERPVINVDWPDARDYARWFGAMTGRRCGLPTEAEWEYACRAGTSTEYALPAAEGGSDEIAGKGLANCEGCGSEWDNVGEAAPVAQFPANAWGLHDMDGNVTEWVEDCGHENCEKAPPDGRAWRDEDGGDCAVRMLRGGSFGLTQDYLGCADRNANGWDFRLYTYGFRVVCGSPSSASDP
jgi:hypothetical protein